VGLLAVKLKNCYIVNTLFKLEKALICRLGCGTWTYPCGTLRERGAISMKPNKAGNGQGIDCK